MLDPDRSRTWQIYDTSMVSRPENVPEFEGDRLADPPEIPGANWHLYYVVCNEGWEAIKSSFSTAAAFRFFGQMDGDDFIVHPSSLELFTRGEDFTIDDVIDSLILDGFEPQSAVELVAYLISLRGFAIEVGLAIKAVCAYYRFYTHPSKRLYVCRVLGEDRELFRSVQHRVSFIRRKADLPSRSNR